MRQSLLIIDDSQAIHDLVRASLADEEVAVRSAYSGEEGIEMAQRICPDVVLLDINMPQMNGFEVCHRLQEDLRLRGSEIIFLSSLSDAQEKVQGFDLGATDYITKPFNSDELCARVRRALKSHAKMRMARSRRVDDFISRSLDHGLSKTA